MNSDLNILVTGSNGQLGSEIKELSSLYSYNFIFTTKSMLDISKEDDIRKIGQMLKGSKAFQIQQFEPNNTLDKIYIKKQPYSNQEIEAMTKIAQTYFEKVKVEGV